MDARFSRAQRIVAGLVIAVGLAFRIGVVAVGAAGSPDARQYHRLGQELVLRQRLAFGPPPTAPSYVRLPGYPLVAGWLIDRGAVDWAEHARRATRWNVAFDLGTALLLLWVGRRLFGAWTGIVAAGLVLFCPLGFLLSAYPLTESLATLLSTAVVALVLWLERPWWRAVLVGLCLGFGILVRFDLISLVPAVALGAWLAGWTRRQVILSVLCAATIYLPWPIRNQLVFGQPHFAGAELMTQAGVAIPNGFTQWMRTWCVARPGEAQLANLIVFGRAFDHTTPWAQLAQMSDSADEQARLAALIDRLGKKGFSDGVDADFAALASERWAAHPWRTLVTLPMLRLQRLYAPPVRGELPIKVDWLGLPDRWWIFTAANWFMYVGALVGAVALWLQRRRKALAIVAVAVLGRTLLHAFAVPHFVGQRYLAEVVPLFLLVAAVGVVGVVRLILRRRPTRIKAADST